jgi:hypothetical protein
MWCPGCHKAFDWNTGMIEHGPIHNPHYYEYSARLGMDLNQPRGACDANRIWNINSFSYCGINEKFRRIHRNLSHLVHVTLENFREKCNTTNRDIGLQFIRNEISELEYQSLLVKREKSKLKNERIFALYIAIRDSSQLHLKSLMNREINLGMFFQEIKNIQLFLDEMILDINLTFKSKLSPIIISFD